MNNWRSLYSDIIMGTNFDSISSVTLNEYVFKFNTKTELLSLKTYKFVNVTTVWKINSDSTISFVTLIPEEYKDE